MRLAVESRVVTNLSDYVRQQGFVRGDKLPSIRQLAETLGLGRNAARDSVLRAQSLGLVRIEPRLGVFVVDPQAGAGEEPTAGSGDSSGEAGNIFHLVDARLLVETEIVRKAAEAGRPEELLPVKQALDAMLVDGEDRSRFVQADEEFHLAIARLAGNPILTSFLQTLLQRLRSVKEDVSLSAASRRVTNQEHIELYRCLLDGRAAAAQAIMQQHVARGRAMLLKQLHNVPTAKPLRAAALPARRRRNQRAVP